MRDDGYTLVEVLAALMIIGLSLSALFAAVNAQAQLQRRAVHQAQESEHHQALSNALNALMSGEGPFSSSGGVALRGDASGFTFDCGQSPPCGASVKADQGGSLITLRELEGSRVLKDAGLSPLRFSYLGARTVSDHWPPDNPTNWQRLQAIALIDKNGAPIALSKMWVEGGQAQDARALDGPANGAAAVP